MTKLQKIGLGIVVGGFTGIVGYFVYPTYEGNPNNKLVIVNTPSQLIGGRPIACTYRGWLDRQAFDSDCTNLGFSVSRVHCSGLVTIVDFETDLPPPYKVGIYRINEYDNYREYPVYSDVIDTKKAVINGNFTEDGYFIQVGKPQAFDNPKIFGRALTGEERETYKRFVHGIADETTQLPYEQATGEIQLRLIDDYEWLGFKPSIHGTLTLGIVQFGLLDYCSTNEYTNVIHRTDKYYPIVPRTDGAGKRYEVIEKGYCSSATVHRVYHEWTVDERAYAVGPYPLRIANADTSKGCGYRVYFNEKTMECKVMRAYSARPDISDEHFVRRGFVSFSVHNGKRVTTDFFGRIYMQAYTNAIPDRMYFEGLK